MGMPRRHGNGSMLDTKVKSKLDERLVRFKELDAKLADPAVGADPQIGDYMRERGTLAKSMEMYQGYLTTEKELADNREIAGDAGQDRELRELAEMEIPELEEKATALETEIVEMILGQSASTARCKFCCTILFLYLPSCRDSFTIICG